MSDANSYIPWLYKKLKLNTNFVKNKSVICSWKINRGQIYTCYFGENIGYEKSRLEARPCIVVSSNRVNHNSGNVIVIPFSKNIKYDSKKPTQLKYPYHYVLKKSKYPKLSCDSAIQCEDIRCVSKARLCTYICNITKDDMLEINKRIKVSLQL